MLTGVIGDFTGVLVTLRNDRSPNLLYNCLLDKFTVSL